MTTNNTPNPLDREWLQRMADAEDRCNSISVGGLAADLGELRTPTTGDPTIASAAVAVGKLVELWRRQQGLGVEDFARRTALAEAEVVLIERGEVVPGPRVLYQISQAVKVSYDNLMRLAGHIVDRDERLSNAAVRFAARSESMERLTRQEEEALHEFINVLAQ